MHFQVFTPVAPSSGLFLKCNNVFQCELHTEVLLLISLLSVLKYPERRSFPRLVAQWLSTLRSSYIFEMTHFVSIFKASPRLICLKAPICVVSCSFQGSMFVGIFFSGYFYALSTRIATFLSAHHDSLCNLPTLLSNCLLLSPPSFQTPVV